MPKIKYTRQTSIIDIEDFRDTVITIVGCGSIGSFVSIALAKMGLTKFILYDNDSVEAHNLPNQFFTVNDLGYKKVVVTQQNMKNFNNECEITMFEEFKQDSRVNSHIVISCVDKMDARKLIFEKCKSNKNVQLFIDTRMGGLQGQVYTIDMNDKE